MLPTQPGLQSQSAQKPPVRVLVVDDSAFMRFTITKYLGENREIQVVGTARDGMEALELIPRLKPDVVTLDVEMPRMDGLSTLREIMSEYPRPVIMLSSLTSEGALETVQALTLGAVDFIAKPDNKANMTSIIQEVGTKILKAAQAKVWAVPRSRTQVPLPAPAAPTASKVVRGLRSSERVVVIGSSTGGPRALNTVVPALPADLPAAVVVVQHMPAGFTRSLAERLDSISALKVKEAAPGDALEVGRVLIAPGGFHLTLDERGLVALNQNPPVHGVRPSVDVTMTAVVRQFGGRAVGVVLTGMGSDGATGSLMIHEAGGKVIAEAESTCVVWGMPRSVVEAGAADQVMPLGEIAAGIDRIVRGGMA